MATKNIKDSKRFVSRSSDKNKKTHLIKDDESNTPQPQTTLPTSTMPTTARSERTPARRVMVIRNTNNPQVNKKPLDLADLAQSNSEKPVPILTNGNTSVYFIRRSIATSGPSNSKQPNASNDIEQNPTFSSQ